MEGAKYNVESVYGYDNENYLPNFSIDCVIIGFHDGTLKVLLNKFVHNNKWMLAGGFVRNDEDVEDAAYKILKARTGLSNVYLRQFYLFGKCNRHNIEDNTKAIIYLGEASEDHWSLQRFVSLGFYALVRYDLVEVSTNSDIDKVEWFSLDKIPPLYGDHSQILKKAIEVIRIQLGYIPIGYELLPDKFTMPELRQIYETILGVELDRRNFQRKMLSLGLIDKLNEKRKAGAHKAPYLYSFNKEKYEYAEKHGLQLMSWYSLANT
jgi:8-oxo-dGTP diphosphatase